MPLGIYLWVENDTNDRTTSDAVIGSNQWESNPRLPAQVHQTGKKKCELGWNYVGWNEQV